MKVRIGIALGSAGVPGEFAAAVDELEKSGVDSLWLPEMVYGPLVEPFIGMAHALSRTARLKVGTGVYVLPGRQPVLVAKQLASLAGLAPGRVLPVFGLRGELLGHQDRMAPGQHRHPGADLQPRRPGQRVRHPDERLDQRAVHHFRQPQRVDARFLQLIDGRREPGGNPGRSQRDPDPNLHPSISSRPAGPGLIR